MFVKINPLLGSNTDPRNRTVNVMRAIRAVATANAGTTPECYAIRDPAGTLETTNNLITTVISTDEAGGWTLDTSSAASLPTNNTYSASCTSPYHIHLYSNTGKTTYPYKTFTYRTNPSYAFNNSFVNYPLSTLYVGISNSTAYNATFHGFTSGEPTGNTSTMLYDWNGSFSAFANTVLNHPLTTGHHPWPFMYSFGEFYLAATSDYIIGVQANSYVTYFGNRMTQSWEDDYNDNPPVVGFHYTKWNSPQGVWGWTRYLTVSNTAVQGPTAIMHKIRDNSGVSLYTNSYSHPLHPVSGISRFASSPTGAVIQYGDRHTTRMMTNSTGSPANYMPVPFFYSHGHVSWNSQVGQGNWAFSQTNQGITYAPVYDSSLQLFVPPAVPMIFQFFGTWFNPGGRLKGIYKSLSGANSFIGQYAVADQDFTVAEETGNTTYRIVSGSPSQYGSANAFMDTFLIRKA